MPVKTEVKLSTLGYVIVYVKDMDKAVSFYTKTLGIKLRMNEGGWAELETGNTTLALHQAEQVAGASVPGQPIVVFNTDDIQKTYEALKESGVKVEGEPAVCCEEEDFIGKSVSFKDPDGNHLSVYGKVKK
jgi:predicted enzyme related to lactoylglutathione lyase